MEMYFLDEVNFRSMAPGSLHSGLLLSPACFSPVCFLSES